MLQSLALALGISFSLQHKIQNKLVLRVKWEDELAGDKLPGSKTLAGVWKRCV